MKRLKLAAFSLALLILLAMLGCQTASMTNSTSPASLTTPQDDNSRTTSLSNDDHSTTTAPSDDEHDTTTSTRTTPTTTRTTTQTPSPTTSIPLPSGGPTTNLSPVNVGPIPKTSVTSAQYVVMAWNDLGMHCINPTYDTAVILPPYNNIWAQVVKRTDPPQIVTQGISVQYRIVNNTSSANKGDFGQFWTNAQKLFGIILAPNTGLNLVQPNVHNSLSGQMVAATDHFEAIGIPLTPIDDANIWNPYQVAEITVRDANNNVIAQTRAMAPVSSEMNCAKCHGADAYNDILTKHDTRSGTSLMSQKPVLCASCHGDPALGATSAGAAGYLSQKVHGFHAKVARPPACYDCHPGQTTKCSRSIAHTTADGNCSSCHGTLANVSDTIGQGRVPWASEPKCVICHTGVAQVDTGAALYRNSTGHGGIYCASCHSSPHAMVPTSEIADNYQALQYQGKAVPISDCAACHNTSRGAGGSTNEYLETHGGLNPEHANSCYICHTNITTTNAAQWPHSFQWKSRSP